MHSPTSPTSTSVSDSPESQPNAKKTSPVMNGNQFGATTKAPFPLKSSAPKEPSKLRFGFAAESDPDSPPPAKSASATPAPAPDQPNVTPSPSSPKSGAIPSRPTPPTPAVTSPLPEAGPSSNRIQRNWPPKTQSKRPFCLTPRLYHHSFNVVTVLKPLLNHAKERSVALVADSSSLPTFAFVFGAKPASAGFNWEAAGMKPPTKAIDSWTCGVCMVNNDAAKAKCVSCEEPRPDPATKGTTTAAPIGGFNWAAAGLKAPSKAPGTYGRAKPAWSTT